MTNGNKRTNNNRVDAGCTCPSEEVSTHGEEEPKPRQSIKEKILAAYMYYRSLGAIGLLYDICIVTIALLAGGLLIGSIIFFAIVYN